MASIYCMNCGHPSEFGANFCSKCGKPFLSASKKVAPIVKPSPLEVENDDSTEKEINLAELDANNFGAEELESFGRPRREKFGNLTPGLVRDPQQKPKKISKKQVLADFQAEAGATRRK